MRFFVVPQKPTLPLPPEDIMSSPTIYKDWFGIWTRILLLAKIFKMAARLVRALRRELRHVNLLQPRRHQIFPWLLQPRPGHIHEEYQDQGRHYVPKPRPDYIHEECQDQYRGYQAQHAPTLSLRVSAGLVHTSEFSPGEMGAGTPLFHFKRLYRPGSMLRRPSEMIASRSRTIFITEAVFQI